MNEMLVIGLIREGKTPADNRVALTPAQCKWLVHHVNGLEIVVQPSEKRCFSDGEYERAGAVINEDLSACNLLLGIKEVPVEMLIPGKTYMFFSHTRKKQPYNEKLMKAMVEKKITLIDYECLEHEDGQRIIGFGFFAGIVGAHNGMMAYGKRTGLFHLGRVGGSKDYRELIHTYFGLKLPKVKIAVTGNGRVAHGILEIMNLMDVREVEPDEFLSQEFAYPVYVHLKGSDLYEHKETRQYNRQDFHANPQQYDCTFEPYCFEADILMNGIFWDVNTPALFSMETLKDRRFRIQTIADVTDDAHGSVPCNLGDQSIDDPVYGVDRKSGEKTAPYLPTSVDMMAVGNLPNELPKDASRYFGEQLIKYVLEDLLKGGSKTLDKATILREGKLTGEFEYLSDYAYGGR
jgi:saccharopine dehydrogenase (NAD+, L-lysine forming)